MKTLAGQFLSYFLRFYLFVVVALVVGLNLNNSPGRLLAQRNHRMQAATAFERILHSEDLAVLAGPEGPRLLFLDRHLELVGATVGEWHVGKLARPELQRRLVFGGHPVVYEFEPERLAQMLREQLDGVQAVRISDLHDRVLGESGSAGGRSTIVALDPLPLQALIVGQNFHFEFPDPRRALLIVCGILLLPFVASQVFARRVTRPLRALQDASEKLASGALETRIASTGEDELGRLANSFNQMAEQLQETSRLKSLFLASVSHELRTPLTAIFGQTQMLRDGLKGPLTPAQDETVQKVQRNAASLLALITDLLDMAKIEADQMDVHPEEFELSECIEAAVDAVEPQAQKKQLELVVDCPPKAWALADFDRTRQILVNLLANAVKFTERGSVQLRVQAVGTELRIEVQDTGVGIRPEDQELVFAEFRQVGKAQAGGTGLGLAISRKLAELQHSRLELHSEFGVGSTFTLTLPAAPELKTEGQEP